MKFIDEAIISIKAGDGGGGAVAFRREPYVPRGGPNGGDGGNGGSVVFRADSSYTTLLDFKYQAHYRAEAGGKGGHYDMNGKNGEDLVLPVPIGTSVYDVETGEMLADLVRSDQTFRVAHGGRGGKGNTFFKTSTNRAPDHAQPGEPGEAKKLRLELKLMADVGLVGLPNAGKSTLISRISAARPKIADYPFTTLAPQLGVVLPPEGKSFVVADLPGLIEGASSGHGLGLQFLRHVERTRLILHLVDSLRPDPLADVRTINAELKAFSPALLEKPQLVVLTKADAVDDTATLAKLKRRIKRAGFETLVISAATGKGLPELTRRTAEVLAAMAPPLQEEGEENEEIEAEKEEGWQP
jgi:GTPase